jgi:hypothetical protein
MSTPRRTPTLLVLGSTLVLPAGHVRDRYRQELLAELHGVEPSHQFRHALGLACHALALRRALTGEGQQDSVVASEHKPLHCRLHLWHHHRKAMTEDGEVYMACVGCGHVKDNFLDPVSPSMSSRGLPMGLM